VSFCLTVRALPHVIGAIEAEYEGDKDPDVGHLFDAALEPRIELLDGD
jgi:hypothetical protein